jgi:hypothetical protein
MRVTGFGARDAPDLADAVRWVADQDGDGTGCEVLPSTLPSAAIFSLR